MATKAPERTVADLSYLLSHTSHVLATRMTAAMAEIGISPRGFCVLLHALGHERTQVQLAEIGDMDKTTMVVTVDELEEAGLAERVQSTVDRRARIIAVTEKGAKIVAQGVKVSDRVHGEVLDGVLGKERKPLVDGLTRLTEGHLAEAVECEQSVRRVRRPRK